MERHVRHPVQAAVQDSVRLVREPAAGAARDSARGVVKLVQADAQGVEIHVVLHVKSSAMEAAVAFVQTIARVDVKLHVTRLAVAFAEAARAVPGAQEAARDARHVAAVQILVREAA